MEESDRGARRAVAESLQRRQDPSVVGPRPAELAAEDLDDLVELAAELQQEARDAAPTATVGEVAAVAAELDIEPQYVDAAVGELGRRRAAATAAAEAERAASEARAAALRARARNVGLAGLAGSAVVGVAVVGLAWVGATEVRAAREQTELAARALSVVVHRQEALAPQVLAGAFEPLPSGPIEAELAASDALGRALSEGLAALPADPANAQLRLNLQHEVTGAQSRIAVERQRWETARAAEQAAESGLPGRLAQRLGWVGP